MSTEQLTDKQISAIQSMSDEVRYGHLVSQAKANQSIWTLCDDRGCVVIDTGEERCIVLFSHEQLAIKWGNLEHEGCKPLAIDLSVFLEKWIEGMTTDGFSVALQPNLDGDAMVESVEEFSLNFV